MSSCRICGSSVQKIMTFGRMPIANGFLTKEEFKNEYFFELAPAYCDRCKMFQIIEQPDPKQMFHEKYAFFSSTSKRMAQHFEEMANDIREFISDPSQAFVIEIGSNDGIMLKHFVEQGVRHLGIEPSENVADVARKNGINTISCFFGAEAAAGIAEEYGQADIISGANVMCHIPDLHSVARGVNLLLKPKGVLVFEDPYLGDMIQKTSYDQIYDEHVYIFGAKSVINAFRPHGLELFHVVPQVTHGGSMRYHLCRPGAHPIRESARNQFAKEDRLGLNDIQAYQTFKTSCEQNKKDLIRLLTTLRSQGKRIVGYAATSKSTTVLNYCGIKPDLIEYISDTTPLKQGKYSPGMHIPIRPYEVFKKNPPDYAVLFAWNHAHEIFEKEKEFVQGGGKWISFVPKVEVLQK